MKAHTIAAAGITLTAGVFAQIPISGVPVPELNWADTNMRDFMSDNDITAGLLAISRNGVIVYQRGFGYHDADESIDMPENALVRIASCTKPFTGAAIQNLAIDFEFDMHDNAFDLGQPEGGLLPHDPFPSLGDSRLRDVTVFQLLTHEGGWDRTDPNTDWTYEECRIADELNVASPPGRTNTLRWILGQPLQFTPGTRSAYSNVGYLAAGLIVEEITGVGLLSYLRENILTPDMWVPSTDLRGGRTFPIDQPTREAWYDGGLGGCVFDSVCGGCGLQSVEAAYGSWDHEARIGQGGLVVSAATMLQFANRYYVGSGSGNIGFPVDPTWSGSHGGALSGVNCRIWQRGDGTNVFIWFNKKNADEDGDNFAAMFSSRIDQELDSQAEWPTEAVDGFWVQPGGPLPFGYFGCFDDPFRGVEQALAFLADGSRVNVKPGSDPFTGMISTKLLLRAPQGTARIGD